MKRALLLLAALVAAAPLIAADLQSECNARFGSGFDQYKTSTPEDSDAYTQTNVNIIADFSKSLPASNVHSTIQRTTGLTIQTSQQPSTGEHASYTFKPTNRVADGTYYVNVTGSDGYITRRSCVKFTVDTPQMDVWIQEPNPVDLPRPDFAITNTSTFNLTLATERQGTCRMRLANPNDDLTNLKSAYQTFGPPTQITDDPGTTHSTTVNLQAVKEPYDVICKETNNPEQSDEDRYAYERITLGTDTTKPNLDMTITPSEVINHRPTTVTITSQDDDNTDEPVVCRLTDTQGLLTYTPKPWKNTTESSYTATHRINATAPTSGETTVTATCTNRAGLTTTANHTFKASYTTSETINILRPSTSITNTPRTPIKLATNSADTECTATINDDTTTLQGQGFTGQGYIHAANTTLPATDGEHTISITCTYRGVRETTTNTTITLDTTPPEPPGLDINDYTCSPDQANFHVTHNKSDITIEYEVSNHTNTSHVYDQGTAPSTDWQATTDLPNLPTNHTVLITTKAIDQAGNEQIRTAQTQIKPSTATVCDQTPPTLTLNKKENTTANAAYTVSCDDNRACQQTYDYSVGSHIASCTYDRQNNLNDTLRVTRSGYLCVAVHDNNDNNDTATRTVPDTPIPHCEDNTKNVDETGVDCGGPQSTCSLCGKGQTCQSNKDCYPTLTCKDGTCQQPSQHCSNGVQDEGETGVDCGGPNCVPCQTKNHCSNGVQDEGETGVDCGGPNCAPCQNNTEPPENSTITCEVDSDCASNNCQDGTCQAPTCNDGIKNQFETGVDCGGPNCQECETQPGKACSTDADCTGAEFTCETINGVKQCTQTPPYCSNNQTDRDETGVDCGGPTCQACQNAKTCQTNQDCLSNVCNNNTCQAPSCNDGIKNQGEGGVDCGIACGQSQLCEIGSQCGADADCTTGNCNADTGLCIEASCTNNKQDGDETDVDCGGATCAAQGLTCANNKACERNRDCASGYCSSDGTCRIPPNKDSDNDGLPDRWEDEHGATTTSMEPLQDPDQDGFTNLEEYKNDTDPNDESSHPPIPENNTPAYILLITGLLFTAGGAVLIRYDQGTTTQTPTPTKQPQRPKPNNPSQDKQTTTPDQTQKQDTQQNQRESQRMQSLEAERDELLKDFDDTSTERTNNAQTSTANNDQPTQIDRDDTTRANEDYVNVNEDEDDEDDEDPFSQLDDLT